MLGIHNPIEISSFEVTKLKLQNLEEKHRWKDNVGICDILTRLL